MEEQRKKKYKIMAVLFSAFFVCFACVGSILLFGEKDNSHPSLKPDSDTGTTFATSPTVSTSGSWTDSGRRGTSFGGGSGTESDPYLISNAEQLAYLAYMVNSESAPAERGMYYYDDVYFRQTNHIDLSAYYWDPIGTSSPAVYFSGHYDGNGYTISGLFTPEGDTAEYSDAGLFGVLGGNLLSGHVATVENLGIVNSFVQGYENVGAIVGMGTSAIVQNCYNTSNVMTSGGSVGGIAGAGAILIIVNCYNTGNISGKYQYVGGIIGDATMSSASSCFNTGTVTGQIYYESEAKATDYVGGIGGYQGSFYNCYNTGQVWTGEVAINKGGIAGSTATSNLVSNIYGGNCTSSTGGNAGADVAGQAEYNVDLTENQFKNVSFISNEYAWKYINSDGEEVSNQWDFSIWGVDGRANEGFPYLVNSLYEIDINIWSHENAQDYRSGTMTQTYNGESYTGSDQGFRGLYVYETWTISDITPAEGYIINSISATYGTLTDNGDGTYTYMADYTRVPAGTGNWDAVINIRMTREDYTLTINPNGGTLNGSTSTTTQTVTYRDMINLATPTRTGYTFKGWQVTSGDATVTETQYLWEEQSFDGVDDYIAIGRDQMYTDKITVSIIAYMDNWSLYGSRNMRLISCTEGGGWNFESNNGYIQVPIYDSGVGYKSITLTKTWASLSSGWHEFTISFDGHNARLFIDGVMEGKSADFSSGEIGYNSTNGIFIGAEAYSTTTTPASGNYFEGIIESVIIVNDYVYGADFSQAGSFVIVHEDTTIRAIWEDTWARHYTMPEGSGTEEDPYRVSTASELAYFAYKTQIQGQESYDHIVLTDDIDLAGYDWLPMGRARGTNTGFRGTFDGQGHTISNLNVNVSGIAKNTEYGLFGLVDSGAVIKNFSIISGQVNGFDNSTGAVAGYAWSATIENVTNYVDVVGATNVGGIVGQLTRGTTISNAINNGNISGTHRVGGIVGGTEAVVATRSLLGVANTGTVTAYDCTGGIIGYGYSISISGAYNSYTATVEGDIGAYTGGIAGYLVQNCIVEGAVNTADVAGVSCVGGLLGGAANGGSLTTSYSEGLISARGSSVTEVGTLVGGASTGMAIADCYFKGTTNKSIGTYYGSLWIPASISSCYAIINGIKNVTTGTFANWVILNGMNNGNPIQKDLIFEGMTDQLPNTADLIEDWIASA